MAAGTACFRRTAGGSRPAGGAPARTAALTAAAVVCGASLAVASGSSVAPPRPAGSVVSAGNPAIRLEGRWDRTAWADTTVNSGSRISLRFTGRRIGAMIAATPRGAQFYSRVDGGPPVLHLPGTGPASAGEGAGYGPAASYGTDNSGYSVVNLTPRPLGSGMHTVEIDVKDVDGGGDRWSPPLSSAFVLTGFLLDRGARAAPLPAAAPRRMLFLGDSITEGIRAAGPQVGQAGADATEDYAWLTGRAFGADFSQVGFGAQGILKRGDGDVPPAPATLRYNYLGSPASRSFSPQLVVVNEGTNDGRAHRARFRQAYLRYLRQIRAAWPAAWIIALRPFDGKHAADIAAAVRAAAGPRIAYVSTAGWLGPDEFTDGLHPSFAGHLNAARRLEPVIARLTGWGYTATPAAICQLLPAGRAGARLVAASDGRERPDVNVPPSMAGAATDPLSRGPAVWTRGYGGEPVLAASPATGAVGPVAARRGWRPVRLAFGHPVRLPAAARDLFLYVSVPGWAATAYDVRLTISSRRTARRVTEAGIPAFSGFLPWARIHIALGTWSAPLTGLTVEVRGDGPARQRLPFLVTGIGWTSQPNG